MIQILNDIYCAFYDSFYQIFDTNFIKNNAWQLFTLAFGLMFATSAIIVLKKLINFLG